MVRAGLVALSMTFGSAPILPEGRPPRPVEIKRYVPPPHVDEPALVPADAASVSALPEEDLLILARPIGGAPLVGSSPAGARLPLRGMWDAPTTRGCWSRRWYALAPRGWVCANQVRRSTEAPVATPVLRVPAGRALPFQYVMVGDVGEEGIPLWASVHDIDGLAPPLFQLRKGDTVAVRAEAPVRRGGEPHYVAEDGRAFPTGKTFRMGEGSSWQGLPLGPEIAPPFGWVTPKEARLYPTAESKTWLGTLPRRTRVPILEEAGAGGERRVRVGDGQWLRASDVNEVRTLPRPTGTATHERWIDIDLGEQVLVAYDGERPVYATLISSGRAIATPRGNYPIWAKASFITMKSQPYEDETYYVDRVPWVLFFQAHNAIHGAYWHDRFGAPKSHGCINVAPRDARWLFEWVPPELPAGWSGTRPENLLVSVTVHVRNSLKRRPFVQERPIGPPNREEERLKLAEAEARRQAETQQAALEVSPAGASTVPGAPTASAGAEGAALPLPPTIPSGSAEAAPLPTSEVSSPLFSPAPSPVPPTTTTPATPPTTSPATSVPR